MMANLIRFALGQRLLILVPTLRRENSVCNAPALRDAGASDTAFPRWSVGMIDMCGAWERVIAVTGAVALKANWLELGVINDG
jgi:hypothetical protein